MCGPFWLGGAILLLALTATWCSTPGDLDARGAAYREAGEKLTAAEAAPPPAAAPESASDEEKAAAKQAKIDHEKYLKAVRDDRDEARGRLAINPLKPFMAKLSPWSSDPLGAFVSKKGKSLWPGVGGAFGLVLALLVVGLLGMRQWQPGVFIALPVVFALATLAFLLAGQKVINDLNLEYALWRLSSGC